MVKGPAQPAEAPEAVMKFAKSPEQGAETSVLLATAAAGRASGGYWVDGKRLGKRKSVLPTVWASHSADCRDAGPGGSLASGFGADCRG